MRHVAVIGVNGQLGTDLVSALGDFRVTGLSHQDFEVCDAAQVSRVLSELEPDVVINTSAFHKVDVCESEPERSFAVNAAGAFNLARAAAELDCTLVHFSSDYVFDGSSARPYVESDSPHPVNVYGVSKLAGEELIRTYCPRHFILRTTGLYGVAGASGKGGNFVETMVRLARGGGPVRVVHDQVMTPTASRDLASAVVELLSRANDIEPGVYHVTSAGQCSWHDFAKEIFRQGGFEVDLSPITSGESGAVARRPEFSVLGHAKWRQAGLAELRPWQDALADYMSAKGHAS